MVRETEKSIGGTAYIFDHEGRMLTGWVNPSDYTSTGRDDLSSSDTAHLRYYRSGGQQADGWQYLASPDDAEESWYYFRDGRAYSTESLADTTVWRRSKARPTASIPRAVW